MSNEPLFKECLEWILENIRKPFVDTATIEHMVIHTLHLAHLEETKQIAGDRELMAKARRQLDVKLDADHN